LDHLDGGEPKKLAPVTLESSVRVTDHFADGWSPGNGVGLERRGRAPWPVAKWRWKGGTFDGEIGPWGEAAWWNGALNAELWQWADGLGWSSASC